MVRGLVWCLCDAVACGQFRELAQDVCQDELGTLRCICHSGLFSVAFCLLVFQVAEAPGEVGGGLCCLLLLAGELPLPLALSLLALGAFFLGAVVQYTMEFSSLGCLLLGLRV